MRLVLTRDVDDFASRTESFLAGRIERNVLATLLVHARSGRLALDGRLFGYATDPAGEIAAAAMRFPPWPLLTTELTDPAARQLVAAWLAADPALPGVSGQPQTARAIARAWIAETGGETAIRMHEAMHVLTEVVEPPRPAAGRLRPAQPAERDRLIVWERDFVREAGVSGADQAARTVDARLARGAQHVWDDGTGTAVATLALSPEIAGVVRIGPVYTPPGHRQRGYATSAVAAAGRQALAAGAQRCMLFTDKSNPTSNKIYAAVGFRPIGDWEEHVFSSSTTAGARPCQPPAAR